MSSTPPPGSALSFDGPLARRHRARLIGSGPELVIFSHGLGTDQRTWSSVIGHLPDRYTILVYDLPGAGPLLPEDFDPGNYQSLSAFADDLLSLLDEIGVTRAAYVGHSVSGMIGVLAAIEDPARFAKLILLNASPRYLDDGDYKGGFSRGDLEGLLTAMGANYQAWVAGFAPVAVGKNVPHAVDDFASGLLAMRPDVTLRIARTIFESDVRALLPLVHVPTVLVHARHDVAVPQAVAEYLHDQIPGSELVWIDAEGHLPHLSSPDIVAATLRRHLGG